VELRRENGGGGGGGGDADNYMLSCRIGGDTFWEVLLTKMWTRETHRVPKKCVHILIIKNRASYI